MNSSTMIIDLIVKISMVLVCVAAGFSMYYFWVSGLLNKISADGRERANEAILKSLKNENSRFNYNSIDLKLSMNGSKFYYPWINPVNYIVLKCVCSFITGLFLFNFSWILAIIGLILGFGIPDALFSISDRFDNDAIVEDIMSIYDTLRLQTKAGVYLSNSLSECYTVVRNRRLKQALLELTGEIVAKNEIVNSVEAFASKFDNQYISSFSIIIRQSLESGKTVKILEDIGNQLKDLKHLLNEKEKTKVNNNILLCQVLIYVGILALVFLVLASSMGEMGVMGA